MDSLADTAWYLRQALLRRRANTRARRLLRQHLTAEQRACLAREGYVVVRGNQTGDEYQVWPAMQGGTNVIRVRDGATFCFYPNANHGFLPRPDVMLGQVLILRHHEAWVLAATRRARERGL